MSKITLELGGKYSAGEMFKRAQDDVKAFGRSTKDASGIGVAALREIANHVDGPLKSGLSTVQGIITGMATGGIFGMVQAVGVGAFQMITQAVQATKERIKECIDFINQGVLKSMGDISAGATTLADQAKNASNEIKSLIQDSNTAINTNAKVQVANIHIQTLQKITDDMSEGARKVIEADGAFQVEMANASAKVNAYANQMEILKTKKEELEATETQIMGKVLDAEEQLAQYQSEHSSQIQTQKDLTEEANRTIQDMVNSGMTVDQAMRVHQSAQEQLNNYISTHTDYLKTANDLQNNVNNILAQRKQVGDMITQIDNQSAQVEAQLNAATIERTAKEREMAQKLNDAKIAAEKEADAAATAASKTAEKSIYEQRQLFFQKQIDERTKGNEKEKNRLTKLLNDELEKGLTNYQIADDLNKEWARLKEEENKKLEEKNKKGDKDKNNSSESMTVTLGSGEAADIGDETEKAQNFKDWQKKLRDEQKKARDSKNNMKIDQAKMTKALKGEMPKAEAQAWMDYAKQKYTPDQMRELGKLAMNTQELSLSEKKKQNRWIEQMATEIKKSLQAK